MKHFTYEFYFDDQKTNEQVIKSKKGNCTDLLQMLINMAEAMDYTWEVIHTQCRQSNGLTNAFGFAIGGNGAISCWSNGAGTSANLGNYTANTDLNCKITFENGTVKYYVSDVLKDTQTLVGSPIYWIVRSWTNSKTVTVTDLKFKPL